PASYNLQLDLMDFSHVHIDSDEPVVHWTVHRYDMPQAPPAQFMQQPSMLQLGSPFPGNPECFPQQFTYTLIE
ncbi:MAG: hypothetical protein K0U52_08170, partial [Gammaproteobacteria bacterium]|nr:hypothetical protein [Gammaproteobacteria bacterium]